MGYKIGQCPKCGNNIVDGPYGFYCENKCGFVLGKVYGRTLDKDNLAALFRGEDIYLTDLKGKGGGRYGAFIHIKGIKENPYTRKDGTPAIGYVWDIEKYDDLVRYLKTIQKSDEHQNSDGVPKCTIIWRDLLYYNTVADYLEAVLKATLYRKLNRFSYFPIINLGYEDFETKEEKWIIRNGNPTADAVTYIEKLRRNPKYLKINSRNKLTYQIDDCGHVKTSSNNIMVQIDDSDHSVYFCPKQRDVCTPQKRAVMKKTQRKKHSATIIEFSTTKRRKKE